MTASITTIVQDSIADIIQVGYTSEKQGIEELIFYLFQEALFVILQLGRLNVLLVCTVDKLAESYRLMDAVAQLMAWSDDLIKLIVQFVRHHMDKSNDKARAVWMAYASFEWERMEQFTKRKMTRYRCLRRTRPLNQNLRPRGGITVNAELAIKLYAR